LVNQRLPVCDLTAEHVENAFLGLEDKPPSYNQHRGQLRSVLGYAVKRKWASSNVAADVDALPVGKKPIQFITAETAEGLLRYAERENPDLIPVLVLGLFCGIRMNEIIKMKWSDIRTNGAGEVWVVVRPEVAKTRRARDLYGKMEPNAQVWLKKYCLRPGDRLITSHFTRDTLMEARRKAYRAVTGKNAPQNYARHSFATMHVHKYHDAGRLILIVGHSNSTITFSNYASLACSEEEAIRYFNIMPTTPALVVRESATQLQVAG
jgi:integrase